MADTPRLLTPQDLDAELSLLEGLRGTTWWDEVLRSQCVRALHSLRAARDEIAVLTAANDGAQSMLTQALRERDAARAALRKYVIAHHQEAHLTDSYQDCPVRSCFMDRQALGESILGEPAG